MRALSSIGCAFTLAALGSACGPSLKKCTASSDCGVGYQCSLSICVPSADAGGSGGGAGGGGVGGGAGDPCVGISCPGSTQCAGGGCVARYLGLTLTGPSRTAAPSAGLIAALTVVPGRTAADPGSLSLSSVAPDGGTAVSVMLRVDAGLYGATVQLPAEGTHVWTASFADAGLSASLQIGVDRTGPSLSIFLPSAPVRAQTASLTEIDALAVGAWRRDERMKVRVVSDALDVSAASVVVRLEGTDGGASSFDGGARCDGGPFCWEVEVDFAAPPMNAYRTRFAVSATAADALGNLSAIADGGQPQVTRWKWSRALPSGFAEVIPALDEAGNVYVSHFTAQVVESYDPNGALRWSLTGQAYPLAPMLGTAQGGSPAMVWLAGASDRTAFSSVSPSVPIGWVNTVTSSASTLPALGVTATANDPIARETAFVALTSPYQLLGHRLGAVVPQPTYVGERAFTEIWPVIARGKVWTLTGNSAGTAIAITPVSMRDAGADELSPGMPELGHAGGRARLAATAQYLFRSWVGAGQGPDLTAFDLSDGGVQWESKPPDAGDGDGLSTPVVGAGDVVFVVHSPASAPSLLCRVALGSQAWLCRSQDVSPGGAALGQGGLLYIGATGGLEVRRQSDLALQWTAPANQPALTALLDCSRDAAGNKLAGRPGVLYGGPFPAGATRLHAMIVDSRGLDPTAPWPLFRHDPRNTANLDSALAPFSCP